MKLSSGLVSVAITFALLLEANLLYGNNCNTNCVNNPACVGQSVWCSGASGCGAGCLVNKTTVYNSSAVHMFQGTGMVNNGNNGSQLCFDVFTCGVENPGGYICYSPGCAQSAGSVCNNTCGWVTANLTNAVDAVCANCGESA
jgi:hypothetical protein